MIGDIFYIDCNPELDVWVDLWELKPRVERIGKFFGGEPVLVLDTRDPDGLWYVLTGCGVGYVARRFLRRDP